MSGLRADGCMHIFSEALSVCPSHLPFATRFLTSLEPLCISSPPLASPSSSAANQPRTTSDRMGFVHFTAVQADVGTGVASFILRDFEAAGVAARRVRLLACSLQLPLVPVLS